MNAKEIAKQYEENRLKVLPLLEELVEQFKKDKSSLDIQQLQLTTEYLIWDREFDENYIDELEKEIEQLKRLWNTRKEREMKVLIENMGCHDTTSTIMELEQNELDVLIKFAKENNKNSKYGCQPSIAIYTDFEVTKFEEGYYSYDSIEYGNDLVEE